MPDIMKFITEDRTVAEDPNGFLLDLDDWSESVARARAQEEGIELTEGHWEVVHFLRDYYNEFGIAPNVRLLMKSFAKDYGAEKASKKYLYDLFPQGPSRQGCHIAGLPRPNDCIDWPG